MSISAFGGPAARPQELHPRQLSLTISHPGNLSDSTAETRRRGTAPQSSVLPRACQQCRLCQQRSYRSLRASRLAAAKPPDDKLQTSSEGCRPSSERDKVAAEPEEHDSAAVRAALAMLDFYRSIISPLLPNTCRYLPTCSQYSKQAYKSFGVSKGTVLTAWRLMRCNPWGGRGYDPPQWPPPGLERLFSS